MESQQELELITNKLALEISRYDVGEIYQRIHSARDGDLEVIKRAGIFSGHFGIVERVYEVLNYMQLEKAGADETDLRDFKTALVCQDNDTIEEICRDNKVDFLVPNDYELIHYLYNAVYNNPGRRVSIDDANSSVGNAYQRLWGRDFDDFSFGATRHDGESVRVPYNEVPLEHKNMFHKMILDSKFRELGFNVPDENGNGKENGENGK